ncbi:MAG TPA: methyltransferase domain-containing protein [Vicinamibacterales bacterium]|nr:methyltransferase domain-containing protein [Vicinamibacterales bacterium]
MGSPPMVRRGEYAARGEYHRTPDPAWDYYPTYIAKLEAVRGYLDALPRGSRVLDAGCGEGVLVSEYADRLEISGVDANYASDRVMHGSVTALPFPDATFDRALCLDVLEHLSFEDQPRALGELHRVLKPSGELLVSVPNLAHLQSRVQFALRGRLIRTASELKHPGDRPAGEYMALGRRAGFRLVRRAGIFPTVPVITHYIRRHPKALAPLHRLLTRALPVPGWCFLNLLFFRKG